MVAPSQFAGGYCRVLHRLALSAFLHFGVHLAGRRTRPEILTSAGQMYGKDFVIALSFKTYVIYIYILHYIIIYICI